MRNKEISGYTYGTEAVAESPVSREDFELLKKTVLFTEEDESYLRLAGEVLADQIDGVLDVWYGFIASHPHLIYFFTDIQGEPNHPYLAAVRERFGQWILDTCHRAYDQDWLNYQHEIGLRHYRSKKNQTDGVKSVPIINYRYVLGFIYPIVATIKPFLAKKGHSADEVEKMHQAWFKSLVMQVTLWTRPYIKDEDY